jgi:hypothetical protein
MVGREGGCKVGEMLMDVIGLPASEALKGITKAARSAQGKKGGVVHIGYLTAIVPAEGQNLGETIKGGAPGMGVDEVSLTLLFHPSLHSHSDPPTGRLVLPHRPHRHRKALLQFSAPRDGTASR